jgi:putative heme-binding domain-containing protein
LEPHGATFTAKRADADCEFLASTDTWFRPVHLTLGPDGGLYVLDFYREVIETPLSLPDDIKKKLNLESRGRGRIWRIVPEGTKPAAKPALSKATTADLVKHVADGNLWWRLTAQRLLVERQDKDAVKALRQLAREAKVAPGRAHALWTLRGLKSLDDDTIIQALKDTEAGVREQAVRLAEERLLESGVRMAMSRLASDPSPRVRFQVSLSLGETDALDTDAAVVTILRNDAEDVWTRTAALSSVGTRAAHMLGTLAEDDKFTRTAAGAQVLTRLAALVGARDSGLQLLKALAPLARPDKDNMGWQVAILEGLGQGLQSSGRSLREFWRQSLTGDPKDTNTAGRVVQPFFERAAAAARDGKRSVADRVAAARLLGYGPFEIASTPLQELLTPQNPAELQLAAIRALSLHDDPKVAELLLAPWTSYSPTSRREVLEALFARTDRLGQLLTAIEEKKVPTAQVEPARLEQLRKHPNAAVRQRAQKLLAGSGTPDRRKVVEDYKAALDLKGDAARGKMLFKKTCSTCHRLENEGTEVGPDLLSALRNKSGEQLVRDILDPSWEVDPRYLNYVVTTKNGRSFTGMIAADTASSITLRRAEKAEDTILREQIDTIEATAKSVMPEGLESQLSKQDVADVIAYLQKVAAPR